LNWEILVMPAQRFGEQGANSTVEELTILPTTGSL
jgi:hypothetical protein